MKQTKLSKIQSGQSKAQAKGARRAPVVTAGLGVAICDALEQQGETVRQAILKCIGQNAETVLQAMLEVTARRDDRLKECTGERKEQKRNSVKVMFSRITVILKAIHAKLNVDKIKAAPSFAIMYAFASRKASKGDGRSAKPFTEEQFEKWGEGVTRIAGEIPGKNAKDSERGKFDKQLARLEQHLVETIGALAKFAHVTRFPVQDMLRLTAKTGKHVKAVPALQRKAA